MSGKKAKSMTIKVTVTVEYGNGDRGEKTVEIEAAQDPQCDHLPPAQDYAAAVIVRHLEDIHRVEAEE